MDGSKGNGLLTYVLLDGLDNQIALDDNNDGWVSVVELGRYARQMMSRISWRIRHKQEPLITK